MNFGWMEHLDNSLKRRKRQKENKVVEIEQFHNFTKHGKRHVNAIGRNENENKTGNENERQYISYEQSNNWDYKKNEHTQLAYFQNNTYDNRQWIEIEKGSINYSYSCSKYEQMKSWNEKCNIPKSEIKDEIKRKDEILPEQKNVRCISFESDVKKNDNSIRETTNWLYQRHNSDMCKQTGNISHTKYICGIEQNRKEKNEYEKNKYEDEMPTIEKDYCDITSYRINKNIIENYKKEKITKLYTWQSDCLKLLKSVKWEKGENFVYVAPTSGGKTLVAEVFIFEHIENHDYVFFTFPLNSLINEKYTYFRNICKGTNIIVATDIAEAKIDENKKKGKNKKNQDIYKGRIVLCTYERLNNYINKKEVQENSSIVIIDEFHIIGEIPRGIYIENVIAKCLFINKKKKFLQTKIVCMSGTFNGLDILKKWMNAKIYISTYRPQQIREHYICNNIVYLKKGDTFQRQYSLLDFSMSKEKELNRMNDNEHGIYNSNNFMEQVNDIEEQEKERIIQSLHAGKKIHDVMFHGNANYNDQNNNGSTENYNSSRKRQNSGEMKNSGEREKLLFQNKYLLKNYFLYSILYLSIESISNKISTLLFCSTKKKCVDFVNAINECISIFSISVPTDILLKRKILNDKISYIDSCAYKNMKDLIINGICYYHSDINNSVKKLIELAFREKILLLLTCTSTLAIGLNLSVGRVIIASPYIAQHFLTNAQYKQMIGRTARLKKGDSFLIVEKKNEKNIFKLFKENVAIIESSMKICKEAKLKFILEMICFFDGQLTISDIIKLFSFSLFFHQTVGIYTKEEIEKKEIEKKEIEKRKIEKREIEKKEIEKKGIEKKEIEKKEIEKKEIEKKEIEKREIEKKEIEISVEEKTTDNLNKDHISREVSAEKHENDELMKGKLNKTKETNIYCNNFITDDKVDIFDLTEEEISFYKQKKEEIHELIFTLIKNECLKIKKNVNKVIYKTFEVTDFCRALCISNFSIKCGKQILEEINKYDKIYVSDYFHLCYLCSTSNINATNFHYNFSLLNKLIPKFSLYTKNIIFHTIGVDSDVINMLQLHTQKDDDNMNTPKKQEMQQIKYFFRNETTEQKYCRLYIALLLYMYIQKTDLIYICQLFKISHDTLQAIIQQLNIHMHLLILFLEQLNYWILVNLLKKFLQQFKCIRQDYKQVNTKHDDFNERGNRFSNNFSLLKKNKSIPFF